LILEAGSRGKFTYRGFRPFHGSKSLALLHLIEQSLCQ
jgi:hypothetical protein